MTDIQTLDEIRAVRARMGNRIAVTPIWRWQDDALRQQMGDGEGSETEVTVKLELFQRTGTFKARGALNNLLSMTDEEARPRHRRRERGQPRHCRGVGGAHDGRQRQGGHVQGGESAASAKARDFGAEVLIAESAADAFAVAGEVQEKEGRTLVHPFEGKTTALGTATLGLEFIEQAPDLDAVIIPIGGGGLIAGMGAAIKQAKPGVKVYGVEPEGRIP